MKCHPNTDTTDDPDAAWTPGKQPPKVLVISGSIRPESYTRSLSFNIRDRLSALGAHVDHWDAATPMLPMADPSYHRTASEYPDHVVVHLDHLARNADAFVMATPVYHNSFSGVLKNLLDLLNVQHHFQMKPVGLVSHGGDRTSQAVDQLRIVARGLNLVAIPTQVCTKAADFDGTSGQRDVISRDIAERIDRFAAELLSFTVLLAPLRVPGAAEQITSLLSPASTS